jgi:hypothetical protein
MNVVQAIRPKDESALRDEPMLLRITAAQFSLMVEAGAFSGGPGVELRGGLLYRINPQYVPHLMAKTELTSVARRPAGARVVAPRLV